LPTLGRGDATMITELRIGIASLDPASTDERPMGEMEQLEQTRR
jgi:hypothetical protein